MANDLTDKLVRADQVQIGDLVDLEGDKFADYEACPAFEYEYQVVEAVEIETPECVAIYFDGAPCVGFPPDHMLRVAR